MSIKDRPGDLQFKVISTSKWGIRKCFLVSFGDIRLWIDEHGEQVTGYITKGE